ncbi:MAG: c-type cytochrome domain-containing protein [Roseibacillus sp.]
MKAISSVFLASSLLLVSCSKWSESETRIDDKPVLSALVQAETKSRIDFARHVKPILEERCVWCHDGKDKKMPYALTNREEAFKNKRIVPGKPDESLFFIAAAGKHPTLKMPSVGMKVAPSDLKVLERWIVSGAVWPQGEVGQLKGR